MVQKTIGRPKKFDRDVGLAAAMEVFWGKGYDGASLDDLTNAMGINRPSLYATYGNKQALYLQALERYGNSFGSEPLTAFESAVDPQKAVHAFFSKLLDNQSRTGDYAQGCLMSSCAATTAGEVEGVTDMLSADACFVVTKLEEGFEKFKASGQLPPNFPSLAKAKLVMDIMQGFAYRSRMRTDRQILLGDIDEKVAQIIT